MRTSTHIPEIEVSNRFRLSLTVDDQGAWRVQHDAVSITILETDEEMLIITRSHMQSGIAHVINHPLVGGLVHGAGERHQNSV